MRNYGIIAAATLFLTVGCGKGEMQSAASVSTNQLSSAAPQSDVIARIDWIGKNQLLADTNAAHLASLWNLPESAKLEKQTLDKLSRAPWLLLLHRAADTNSAALLRPLLDDMLESESRLEIRETSNNPGALAFAIRLNNSRAELWKTNLAKVLQSLTGIQPAHSGNGWSLKKHDEPNLIELTRSGDWTILGIAQNHNDAIPLLESSLKNPKAQNSTNFWLTADLDLNRISRAFALSWKLPENTPKLAFTVTGDGEYVRTRGELDFPAPLSLNLESWNVPTNFIHGQLNSLTAVRGIGHWLQSLNLWKNLQLGDAPNQLFTWGLPGLPPQVYLAAPWADASNHVARISAKILQKGSPWFSTNELAGFEKSTTFNGIRWKGFPFLYPFLKSEKTAQGEFAIAGSVLTQGDNSPPPADLITGLLGRTNDVYYDREFTAAKVEQWIYISQFVRQVSGKSQLPFGCASILWLKAIMPKLGSSATDISQTGPTQLSFARTSGIGFTAMELNLLADWLESPRFPLGLHTTH
ncbi:MAG TPA: hypothetical protein VFM25_00785 [Verrucomicrobiae bacterium]|nr:hypothetical protein [Verrucomicrobiae bacterium]